MIDGLYDIPNESGRNYNLYDYQPRDLGIHPEDKISDASKVMAALFFLAHAGDWAQTLHIARNPDKFYEKDMAPIIGEHPSTGKVNAFMAIEGIIKGLGPLFLPGGYRETAQGLGIAGKLKVLKQNNDIGIGLHF